MLCALTNALSDQTQSTIAIYRQTMDHPYCLAAPVDSARVLVGQLMHKCMSVRSKQLEWDDVNNN